MTKCIVRLLLFLLIWSVLGLDEAPAQGRRPPRGRSARNDERVEKTAHEESATLPPEQTADLQNRLEKTLARLERIAGLTDEARERLLGVLEGARAEVQRVRELSQVAAEKSGQIESLPALVNEVRRQLAETEQPSIEGPVDGDRESFARELETLQAERDRRAQWLDDFGRQRGDLESQLADESDALAEWEAASPKSAAEKLNVDAETLGCQARIARLQTELDALTVERKWVLASESYLADRIRLAELKAASPAESAAAEKPESSPAPRAVEPSPSVESASEPRSADEAPGVEASPDAPADSIRAELKPLVDRNAEIQEQITGAEGLVAKIAAANDERRALEALDKGLNDAFESAQSFVQAASVDADLGAWLQRRRSELPDLGKLRQELKARRLEIIRLQRLKFTYEEEAQTVDVSAEAVSQLGRQLAPKAKASDRQALEGEITKLLGERRTLLQERAGKQRDYVQALDGAEQVQNVLAASTEHFLRFIDDHVLWVQSDPPLEPADAVRAWRGLVWFFGPAQWSQAGKALKADLWRNPLVYALAVLVFAPWIWLQRRLRKTISVLAEQSSESYSASIRPAWIAVCTTGAIAAVGPALAWFFGWRLSSALEGGDFPLRVGAGLESMAAAYLIAECFRQICRRNGLGEAHFGWSRYGMAVVRRNMRWALVLALPLRFVSDALENAGAVTGSPLDVAALSRLTFVAGMLVLAVFAARVLHPRRGAFRDRIAAAQASRLDRLHAAWYVGGVGLTVATALLAAAGYFYTAHDLAWRFKTTLWLGLGLVVVHAFLLRWILVARRRLAIEQARQRRLTASDPDAAIANIAPNVDLAAVNVQANRLLRSFGRLAMLLALWATWDDVLPALRFLDRWTLWQPAGAVAEAQTANDNSSVAAKRDPGVTLGDVAIAGLISVVTMTTLQNLPGLLEMVLWQRLPLDAGARYALGTLSRYAILLAGGTMAARSMGIGWENVQWLVAAMTVGLGFGLQEIFANFVSGLIILFERPVRVGDTVTVGDVSGTVTRIRIRATTIVDSDRKELVVPNKEFITGKVLNWTLSDTIVRLVIKVGVAYGADPSRVRQLLVETAKRHPHVLAEPGPSAVFDTFGDNALNFELRVYLDGVERYSAVKHDLNAAIDQAFNHAGLEAALENVEPSSTDEAIPPIRKSARTLGGPVKATGGSQKAA